MIQAQNIALQKGAANILNGVSLHIEAGELVGLIGPNGVGKSSLMRALLGFEKDAEGACNLWQMPMRARARAVAWLSQDREVNWDLNVWDVIALGRTPWRGWRGALSQQDHDAINQALERTQTQEFIHKKFHDLSGGEKARVLFARLLAQDTPTLIADEPIAALDPAFQLEMMDILKKLAEDGRALMISIHDLGLAARYCSRLILLDDGKIHSEGEAEQVLSDENLQKIFGVKVYRAHCDGPILQPIERVEN